MNVLKLEIGDLYEKGLRKYTSKNSSRFNSSSSIIYIRVGLQRGSLSFGTALNVDGNRYTYLLYKPADIGGIH